MDVSSFQSFQFWFDHCAMSNLQVNALCQKKNRHLRQYGENRSWKIETHLKKDLREDSFGNLMSKTEEVT